MNRNFYFLTFIQSLISKCKCTERITVWQGTLAVATALMFLASFLWVIPWQGRHDGPATKPQSIPVQDSDQTAEETAQPTPQPLDSPEASSVVPNQAPEFQTAHGENALQSPALQDHPSAMSEEPAEVLDTQVMQEFVTRLDVTRGTPGEHLDTKAMDNLLAGLESSAKPTLPTAPRPKVAKKKGARSRPRATPGSETPGSAPSPQSDPVPRRSTLAS